MENLEAKDLVEEIELQSDDELRLPEALEAPVPVKTGLIAGLAALESAF